MQGQVGAMVEHAVASSTDPEEIYKTGLHTTSLLEGLAEVIIGWLLIRHAAIAIDALEGADEADRSFYEGKIASARWFSANMLPEAALRRALAEGEDGSLMEMPVEAF
jgi:hypothetical protein